MLAYSRSADHIHGSGFVDSTDMMCMPIPSTQPIITTITI